MEKAIRTELAIAFDNHHDDFGDEAPMVFTGPDENGVVAAHFVDEDDPHIVRLRITEIA